MINIYEHIKSPCKNICELDLNKQICKGCYRTIKEIAEWSVMKPGEKKRVLSQLEARGSDYNRKDNE